jgi:predicted porin
MIGGRIGKVSGAALIAAAGLLSGSIAAQAADLGGNCCADLEERVAELEATTVRKGNRKVSLTLSGHVNEALLFWDDGINSGMQVTTNLNSQTRFRFLGSAQINADWSAGFYIEFGLGASGASNVVSQDDVRNDPSAIAIRHSALWMKSRTLGTLWLGHTTDAVDGMQDICLGCPITSSIEMLSWHGFQPIAFGQAWGLTWSNLGIGNEGYFATRVSVLKYVSPTIAGFSLTASINDANETADAYGNSLAPFTAGDGREHGYDWDIALRYAGEFGAIRVAAGIGYSENTNVDGFGTGGDSWIAVASMQHVPTGLFIQGNYKESDGMVCGNCDHDAWSVTAGIVQRWSALGATTFWGQYSSYKTSALADGAATGAFNQFLADALIPGAQANGDVWAVGLNQKIDAAAMELYLTYWNVQGDLTAFNGAGVAVGGVDLETSHFVMAGARINF